MSILEVHDVSIRYMTGDFKDIGLKEYAMKKLKGEYQVTEFWADRNVSFTLEKGEMLGIIGANGAGKSTLLKAVAGIMEPTEGYVKRQGSVAALLELASGFDGDLTVRENAYLRGAMLGYTRKFMDETYDRIIDFAELRDFQDRPFRQLSSGMKSRLAFSIASLVQPDTLILDEVLSVGDGAFRKKSEQKMKEIIAGGATTILVSHSIEQVKNLCTKILWLDHGDQIAFSSDVDGICGLYQRFLNQEITLEQAKAELHPERQKEGRNAKPEQGACAQIKEGVVIDRRAEHAGPEDMLLLLGIFILNLFFFTLADTTLLFFLGVRISGFNLPAAIVCSTISCFFLSGRSKKQTIQVLLFAMLFLGISALLSNRVFDSSWDGNRYHKSMIGALRYGWNPLRETFYDFAEDIPFLAEVGESWYDAYPKGTEIWAASLYSITNNIETGKCLNFLAMIALFCICYAILAQTKQFRRSQMVLAAFLCVVNPITMTQVTTYYVDGFLWQMFLACMVALLYLTFFCDGKYKNGCAYLIFITICLGLNIKFSALVYFGILCISFFGYWAVQKCLQEGWRAGKRWILNRFMLFASAVIFGTGFLGATSYGINIVRHANPLYTMIGNGRIELLNTQLPKSYKDMAHPVRFVASLFSKTSNTNALEQIEWKVPFTYSATEIAAAQHHDTRTAGWGILFSGIFILSLIVIWVAAIRLKNRKGAAADVLHLATLLIAVYACSICFVPGLCWARYNGVLLYIPVGALLYLFGFMNKNRQTAVRSSFVAGMLSITILMNIAPNVERVWLDFKAYRTVYNQLVDFKALSDSSKSKIIVGYKSYRFEGQFFALYDMGITNFEYGTVDPKNCSGMLLNPYRALCYTIQEET